MGLLIPNQLVDRGTYNLPRCGEPLSPSSGCGLPPNPSDVCGMRPRREAVVTWMDCWHPGGLSTASTLLQSIRTLSLRLFIAVFVDGMILRLMRMAGWSDTDLHKKKWAVKRK